MITLEINSQKKTSEAPAETPLLWVLRDELKLKGTKFGCGKGLCGACTVHVDGTPMRSCILPLAAAVGKKIVTIEGLDPKGEHPLQRAWVKFNVPQCGYCQPGQLMSAAGLLQKVPAPTDQDIDQHMRGNICRCGTYPRIRAAIKEAALETSSTKRGTR